MSLKAEGGTSREVEAPNQGEWAKFWIVTLGVSAFTGSATALAIQVHPLLGAVLPTAGMSVIAWCLFTAIVRPVKESERRG